MSSLRAECALVYTPVDNLVFMEELQPQHHTGGIEAAETHKFTQAWLHRAKVPNPWGPKALWVAGWEAGWRVGGGEEGRGLQ